MQQDKQEDVFIKDPSPSDKDEEKTGYKKEYDERRDGKRETWEFLFFDCGSRVTFANTGWWESGMPVLKGFPRLLEMLSEVYGPMGGKISYYKGHPITPEDFYFICVSSRMRFQVFPQRPVIIPLMDYDCCPLWKIRRYELKVREYKAGRVPRKLDMAIEFNASINGIPCRLAQRYYDVVCSREEMPWNLAVVSGNLPETYLKKERSEDGRPLLQNPIDIHFMREHECKTVEELRQKLVPVEFEGKKIFDVMFDHGNAPQAIWELAGKPKLPGCKVAFVLKGYSDLYEIEDDDEDEKNSMMPGPHSRQEKAGEGEDADDALACAEEPPFAAMMKDILAGKHDHDYEKASYQLEYALWLADQAGLFEKYEDLFMQASYHLLILLRKLTRELM